MVLAAKFSDNEHGIPHYMGMTGKSLSLAVSVVATTGFLLFGYDREFYESIYPCFHTDRRQRVSCPESSAHQPSMPLSLRH